MSETSFMRAILRKKKSEGNIGLVVRKGPCFENEGPGADAVDSLYMCLWNKTAKTGSCACLIYIRGF